jgi:predicted DCC family thiol-disulfide oxidoreductase YuxK
MENEELIRTKTIVMFDGVCNLCNGLIQFLIPRDPKKNLIFAPLQSDFSKEKLKMEYSIGPELLNTVVVISNGKVFQKYRAIIEIFSKLSFPWFLLTIGRLVPIFIGNKIYDYVAANRYKWFGKQEKCMMPTPEIMERFLKPE